jgi:predicted DNA-binding antitoxin AbrB/MazE fold protein
MGDMPRQVEAIYENGVLRPLEPLGLTEHQHVLVSVSEANPPRSALAVEYIERMKREADADAPAPGVEEVRRRLAKIPGSMSAEIITERGDR